MFADGDGVWIHDWGIEESHAYPMYADSKDHLVQV